MRIVLLLMFAVVGFLGEMRYAHSQEFIPIHRTLQAFGVTARIGITKNVDGNDVLNVRFERPYAKDDSLHVYCLNANRDLTFQLVDSVGNVVPVNPSFSQQESLPAMMSPVDAIPPGPGGCGKIPRSVREVVFALVEVYPKVPKGSYTLHIFFKPPGVSGSPAEFDPIPIVVVKDNLI